MFLFDFYIIIGNSKLRNLHVTDTIKITTFEANIIHRYKYGYHYINK